MGLNSFCGWAGVMTLRTNDVIVLVGGSALVAENESGVLETALKLAHPGHGLRIRNLAREGDTVYAQPREVNYPTLPEQVSKVGATVVFVQFGQTEALEGVARLSDFDRNYGQLLETLSRITPRIVLIAPPPFERSAPPLPDLELRNPVLEQFVRVIREQARARNLPLIDAFAAARTAGIPIHRRTLDGLQLTAAGEAHAAAVVVRALGFTALATSVDQYEGGILGTEPVRKLRAAVIEKDRLWFEFVRPTNWAFLGGDRTDQLSSRDHRDPKVRWFPKEMEQFQPLITDADRRIDSLARDAASTASLR